MEPKIEYATADENFKELLEVARKMSVRDIKQALVQRAAFHSWAVKAYEQALEEKQQKKGK